MRNSKFLSSPLVGTILLLLTLPLYIGSNKDWIQNSYPSIFSGLATVMVGLYAFALYERQKIDAKKDSANILLLELQNAEKVLKLAQKSLEKDTPELPYDTILMPTESWSKNKYLFVGDFDTNQWEAITNFYNACALFDEAVRTHASYFQKNEEQIRVNIQRRSAELTEEYDDKINKAKTSDQKTKLEAELASKVTDSTNLYLRVVSEYRPVKPINDAKVCLEIIKLNISLPSAISKLKELVK